ncbi:MAG: DUF3027 domain-containing protein [Paeniglutamicibacter terrestris]
MARKPLLDTTLAKAVDQARAALLEITDESTIGEHLDSLNDGERLVTHLFDALQPGYEGWCWFSTVTRVARAQAKDITVCEVGILPGKGALLAPAWVPWAERVRPEEIDAERRAAEEAAAIAEGTVLSGAEDVDSSQLAAHQNDAEESIVDEAASGEERSERDKDNSK